MMHYNKTGNGPAVVLIHGFAENNLVWNNINILIKSDFSVILPDLPGFGNSVPQNNVSMESLADGINEILQKESIENATIIGHSLGGYITLAFLEKYPGKLNGIGLFHSTSFKDTDQKKEARRKSIKFLMEHKTAPFLEATTPNLFSLQNQVKIKSAIQELIEENKTIAPETLIQYYESMMNRPSRTEILKKSPVPVLFIAGVQDQAIPYEDSLEQMHLPDLSYIHILKETAHMGMLEEPEKAGKAVLHFLTHTNPGFHF